MSGAAEMEHIRSRVRHYFSVYDALVSYASVTFYISPDMDTLEDKFDSLRREFKGMGLIPTLRYKGGEYQLVVSKRPPMKRRSTVVNWVMLAITLVTTILAGAVLWASYDGNGDLLQADNFLYGALFFAFPLLAILGTHELSHYLMARRHGVEASLPFFIPSIPPLGTFGAFISIRDPMPDRKALIDIGIAGPIGGLLVTIPVTLIGLFLTSQGDPASGAVSDAGAMMVMLQPIFELFLAFIPLPDNVMLHPTAFAAWVGFLVTAINLLPAGQLDGGHVARAVLGENAKYLSFATAGLLVILSFMYSGWFLFALLIIFLGLRHPAPLNDISKIDRKRVLVGALGVVILMTTFLPIPLMAVEPEPSFDIHPQDGNVTEVAAGGTAIFTVLVENTGNTDLDLTVSIERLPAKWGSAVYLEGNESNAVSNNLPLSLGYEATATLIIEVEVPMNADQGDQSINIMADGGVERELELIIRVA
jgi:uncharacterized repeat protein (TIGR01451 family)